MADKPSRALVLYGDGLARFVGPTHTPLYSFASRDSCGFLALPHSPFPIPLLQIAETEETRLIREFAELLDSAEAYDNWDESQEKRALQTTAERFMGMKAVIITDKLSLKSFGGKVGLSVLQCNDLCDIGCSVVELPSLASRLLKLLGFQNGKILDTSQFDLVFVHVGANKKINDLKGIEIVNQPVGNLLHVAESETDIGSRIHLSVVMSYGAIVEDEDKEFSIFDTKPKNNSELLPLFPSQSYMLKGGKPRVNIRQHCSMLLAQFQNAVTRKDMVGSFSFRDFIKNGGNLVIPADRFLHEVAFKLWKAPKYGA